MTLQVPQVASILGKQCRELAMPNLSRRSTIRGFVLLAAGSQLARASRCVAAEDVPLAIKGYDPVAYFADGKPTHGRPEIEYEWDEHRYSFSSDAHRELFMADPVHYAPQFGNFCAMALANGEVVVANPENWLISDGKLYVFGKAPPFGPAMFEQDLSANIAKANQNRAILPKD
jgi:hypothetical protein